MFYFYIIKFQCIANYKIFQWKLFIKKWQVKIWLIYKQKNLLSCFAYIKYKIMLIKNIILYFVEFLTHTHNVKNHLQTIYKNFSKNIIIKKILLKFKNIKNSFLN